MRRRLFDRLGGFDLDPEAGESDISARAGGEEPDRGDAEVPQNLCAEADVFPLPAALQLRSAALLRKRHCRHPRGAVAQVDEDTAPGMLEPAQRGMDRLGAAEHVFHYICAVQPGGHAAPVADLAIDEGVMVHLVE